MEDGIYSFHSFRMSPSWAVYLIKHIVNVSLQRLLQCVLSREETLVED
jgi:hypothetical protein